MLVRLQTFWWEIADRFREDGGAAFAEYALVVALIAVAAMAMATAFAGGLGLRFTAITNAITP